MKKKIINNKQSIISPFNKEFLYDKTFYESNNLGSFQDLNKLGYSIGILSHTIEKGLSHFILRPFGEKKIDSIMFLLNKELKYKNHEEHFSFLNGINSLREYKNVYEKYNWLDKRIYKKV